MRITHTQLTAWIEEAGTSAPGMRATARRIAGELKDTDAAEVIALVVRLVEQATWRHRILGYEILCAHKPAFHALDETTLERLGCGNNDWATVDAFACYLVGPAWLAGRISDKRMLRWATSKNLWLRRTALAASTILNKRSFGGYGDTGRTMMVCTPNAADREDMIVKALSWALRSLVPWDRSAVQSFLAEYDGVLAPRVKREVKTKLTTGLKNRRK